MLVKPDAGQAGKYNLVSSCMIKVGFWSKHHSGRTLSDAGQLVVTEEARASIALPRSLVKNVGQVTM